jgi:hypothetical protein
VSPALSRATMRERRSWSRSSPWAHKCSSHVCTSGAEPA